MTGFNRRFSAHARKAKDLLAGRSNPFIVNYRVNAGYLPNDHWVHGAQGGGRNIGEACHFYDLFVYLAGAKAVSINALPIKPQTAHYRQDDNFCAIVSFADGSVANLSYTALGSSEYPKERIDIYSDGRVIGIEDFRALNVAGSQTPNLNANDKGHAAEWTAFVEAVKGRSQWPIPFWEQAEAMRIAFDVQDKIAGASAP
jgi:predicted dehydrogenase